VLVGYVRVSKADGTQTTDLQRDALLAAGIDADCLYEDRASGKKDDRPELAACLKALRHEDTLVVWKLDRLGRDLRHLVNIVHDLTARGVGLKVLTGQGAAIDTTTASGKLVFGIFAALAEFERELISERTLAGLASARARGRNGGRPFKMTPAKLRLAMASMASPEPKSATSAPNSESHARLCTGTSHRPGNCAPTARSSFHGRCRPSDHRGVLPPFAGVIAKYSWDLTAAGSVDQTVPLTAYGGYSAGPIGGFCILLKNGSLSATIFGLPHGSVLLVIYVEDTGALQGWTESAELSVRSLGPEHTHW
jgi:DNA invertase Pin-like site-specific DNA recombinase